MRENKTSLLNESSIIQCTIEFREDTNRTYDCVFYPTIKGEYKVNL